MVENEIISEVAKVAGSAIGTYVLSKAEKLLSTFSPAIRLKVYSPQFLTDMFNHVVCLDSQVQELQSENSEIRELLEKLLTNQEQTSALSSIEHQQKSLTQLDSKIHKIDDRILVREQSDLIMRSEMAEFKKRMNNIEDIFSKAEKQISDNAEPSQLNMKFKNQFIETAAETEEEELRELLANILAGEINNPGKISPKLLSIVKLLTKKEIMDFKKLLKHIIVLVPKNNLLRFDEMIIYMPTMDTHSLRSLKNLQVFDLIDLHTVSVFLNEGYAVMLSDGSYYEIKKQLIIDKNECYLSSVAKELAISLLLSYKITPSSTVISYFNNNNNIKPYLDFESYGNILETVRPYPNIKPPQD